MSSASTTAAGMVMIWPHAGHLAFLPAAASGAESVLPHDWQLVLIGTMVFLS
jgi:hypothetical protein